MHNVSRLIYQCPSWHWPYPGVGSCGNRPKTPVDSIATLVTPQSLKPAGHGMQTARKRAECPHRIIVGIRIYGRHVHG